MVQKKAKLSANFPSFQFVLIFVPVNGYWFPAAKSLPTRRNAYGSGGIRVVSPVGRFAGSFRPGSFRPCFMGGSFRPY